MGQWLPLNVIVEHTAEVLIFADLYFRVQRYFFQERPVRPSKVHPLAMTLMDPFITSLLGSFSLQGSFFFSVGFFKY